MRSNVQVVCNARILRLVLPVARLLQLISIKLFAALQVVDAAELTIVDDLWKQPVVIAVAAWFGTVRLIDNIEIDVRQCQSMKTP